MNKLVKLIFCCSLLTQSSVSAWTKYDDSHSFTMSYENGLLLQNGHLLVLKEANIWPKEGSEIYTGAYFSLYDSFGRIVKMNGKGSVELSFEDRFKFVEVVDFIEASNGDIWMIGMGIFEDPENLADAYLMSGKPQKVGLEGDENWEIISRSQQSEKNHWFLGRLSNLKSGEPEFEYHYLDHLGHPVYRPSNKNNFMSGHPYLNKIVEWQNGFAVSQTKAGIWELDGRLSLLDLDRTGKLRRKPFELPLPKNDFLHVNDLVTNPTDPSEVFLTTHGYMQTHFMLLAAKDRLTKRASTESEASIKINRTGAIYDPRSSRIMIYGTDWDDVGVDLEFAQIDPANSAYNLPLRRKLNPGFAKVSIPNSLRLQRHNQGGFSVIGRPNIKGRDEEDLIIYSLAQDLNITRERTIPKVFEQDGPCRFLLGEIQMIADHLYH